MRPRSRHWSAPPWHTTRRPSEAIEAGKETRETATAVGWQSTDPEGRRQRARESVGLRRAGMEGESRATTGRAHRSWRAEGSQGDQVEFAFLRKRIRRLVHLPALLHQLHQGDVLLRRVTGSNAAATFEAQDGALS